MKFLNLSWQVNINALPTCFFGIGENIYSLTQWHDNLLS